MKTRPTLVEVAALAGVSKMTASRALRGAADVSERNIGKVLQAAEEIGYVTNYLATSLSSQSTNLIGVVVPSMSNIVFAEVLAGISEAIQESGKQPVFGISNYDEATEKAIIRDMLSWRPAGMIVTGLEQAAQSRKLLEGAGIPVVQIMDVDGDAIDINVGLSHSEAGRDMARALIELGRSKFAYVGAALENDVRARKRMEGFRLELERQGAPLVASVLDERFSSLPLGRSLTTDLLARGTEIDCIYYSNDDMAAGGLFACMAAGVEVPQEITLAGFNGLEFLEGLPVRLATARSPRREIGAEAIRRLLAEIEQPLSPSERCVVFRPEIDLGDAKPHSDLSGAL